jgi:acyl-coenzyme A thioesterase PaaI-like protein
MIQIAARIGKKFVRQGPQQAVLIMPVDEQHASAIVISVQMG